MDDRTRSAIARLDEAFEGDATHSLIANLATVRGEDWTWLPAGGGRTLRDLAKHAGGAKLMYGNRMFGDGELTYGDPSLRGGDATASPEAAIAWLRAAHAALREGLEALGEGGLDAERPVPWGGSARLETMAGQLVRHDIYHAGEINHLRALAQGSDAWQW